MKNMLDRLTNRIKKRITIIKYLGENAPSNKATSAPKIKKTASEKAWEQAKSGNVFSKENVLKQDLFKPSPSLSQDQAKAAIKTRLALNDTMKRLKEAERKREAEKKENWKQEDKGKIRTRITGIHHSTEKSPELEKILEKQNKRLMKKGFEDIKYTKARQAVEGLNTNNLDYDTYGKKHNIPGLAKYISDDYEKYYKKHPFALGFSDELLPTLTPKLTQKRIEAKTGIKMDLDDAYDSGRYTAGSMVGQLPSYFIPGGAVPKVGKALYATKTFKSMPKIAGKVLSTGVADAILASPLNAMQAYKTSDNLGDFSKNMAMNTALDVGLGGVISIPGVNKEMKGLRATNVPKGVNPKKWGAMPDKDRKAVLKALKKSGSSKTIGKTINPKVQTLDNGAKPSVSPSISPTKGADVTANQSETVKKAVTKVVRQQEQTAKAVDVEWNKIADNIKYKDPTLPDNEIARLTYNDMASKYAPDNVGSNAPFKAVQARYRQELDNIKASKYRDDLLAKQDGTPPPKDPSSGSNPLDEAWKDAQKSGTYPGGTPKEVDGLKTRRGIDTAMRGEMSEEAKDIVKGDILAQEVGYTTRKQSKLLEIADRNVADNPKVSIDLMDGFRKTGGAGAKDSDIAEGVALMKYARSINNPQLEAETAETLSLMLTESGRAVAAGKMMLRATPQGRLNIVDKLAEKLTLRNRKTGKGKTVELPKETREAIVNAKTPEEISEANLRAQTELWNQVPATWKEKADAWRYMAMLGNPKTHIRNIIGNILFSFPRAVKNAIATTGESIAVKTGKMDAGDRTQALFPSKESVDYGYADFEKMKTTLRGQSAKFSDSARPLDSTVFRNRVLEKGRQLSGNTLDMEDLWTMKPAYAKAMGRYMKAQGLNPADMTGDTLQRARTVAGEEALRATYRDYTALGSFLSRIKNVEPDTSIGRKVAGLSIDATMPFTKTPINIMRRGFDYSPFGLIKGIGKIGRAKTGAEAVKAIDEIASGLTGSGIFGLGLFLNQQGIINLEIPFDDTGSYLKDLGEKGYSLKVGDYNITLDWAVPMAMPFFLGAQAYESVKDGVDFTDVGMLLDVSAMLLDVSAKIFDPTMELSVMQGVTNALDSVKFKDSPGDTALALGLQLGTGYASQYHPTLLKQTARFIDPVQRSTKSTAESATTRKIENFLLRTRGGIPELSQRNEPYIDKWGREVKDERPTALRAFETFLSPAYFSKDKKTDVDREILRLHESLGDDEKSSVIPKGLNGYDLTLGGVDQRLGKGDLTTYNKIKGQESYRAIQELVATQEYKNMSDSEKASAIAKAYKKAGKEGKAETLVGMGNDPWAVYTDEMKGNRKEMHTVAKESGLEPKQYRDLFETELQFADGKQNWSQYDAYQALEATDLSTEQKASIWNAYNKTWKRNPYLHGYVPEKGGSSGGGKSGRKKGRGGKGGKGGRSAKAPKPIKTESEKLFTKATSGNIDYRFKMPQNLSTSERKAIIKLLKKKFNA